VILLRRNQLIGFTLRRDHGAMHSSDHRLVDPNIDPQLVAFIHHRVLLAPVVYLVSIALSFISTVVAELLFCCGAPSSIVPNPLDHYRTIALSAHPTVRLTYRIIFTLRLRNGAIKP